MPFTHTSILPLVPHVYHTLPTTTHTHTHCHTTDTPPTWVPLHTVHGLGPPYLHTCHFHPTFTHHTMHSSGFPFQVSVHLLLPALHTCTLVYILGSWFAPGSYTLSPFATSFCTGSWFFRLVPQVTAGFSHLHCTVHTFPHWVTPATSPAVFTYSSHCVATFHTPHTHVFLHTHTRSQFVPGFGYTPPRFTQFTLWFTFSYLWDARFVLLVVVPGLPHTFTGYLRILTGSVCTRFGSSFHTAGFYGLLHTTFATSHRSVLVLGSHTHRTTRLRLISPVHTTFWVHTHALFYTRFCVGPHVHTLVTHHTHATTSSSRLRVRFTGWFVYHYFPRVCTHGLHTTPYTLLVHVHTGLPRSHRGYTPPGWFTLLVHTTFYCTPHAVYLVYVSVYAHYTYVHVWFISHTFLFCHLTSHWLVTVGSTPHTFPGSGFTSLHGCCTRSPSVHTTCTLQSGSGLHLVHTTGSPHLRSLPHAHHRLHTTATHTTHLGSGWTTVHAFYVLLHTTTWVAVLTLTRLWV